MKGGAPRAVDRDNRVDEVVQQRGSHSRVLAHPAPEAERELGSFARDPERDDVSSGRGARSRRASSPPTAGRQAACSSGSTADLLSAARTHATPQTSTSSGRWPRPPPRPAPAHGGTGESRRQRASAHARRRRADRGRRNARRSPAALLDSISTLRARGRLTCTRRPPSVTSPSSWPCRTAVRSGFHFPFGPTGWSTSCSSSSLCTPSPTSTDRASNPCLAAPTSPQTLLHALGKHALIIDRLSDRYVALHGGSSFNLGRSPVTLPPGADEPEGPPSPQRSTSPGATSFVARDLFNARLAQPLAHSRAGKPSGRNRANTNDQPKLCASVRYPVACTNAANCAFVTAKREIENDATRTSCAGPSPYAVLAVPYCPFLPITSAPPSSRTQSAATTPRQPQALRKRMRNRCRAGIPSRAWCIAPVGHEVIRSKSDLRRYEPRSVAWSVRSGV